MAVKNAPQYLDPKVLAKISRMDLRARLVVEGFISGMHKSPYHGYSVEFASHREYVPGDEIKHIDWKVWARGDRFYIKQYEEETNLRCTILLDCSKSMKYGEPSDQGQKGEGPKKEDRLGKFGYSATVAASLAYLLQQQQDATGLVMFDTDIRTKLPISSHPSHLKLILHELDKARPDNKTEVGAVFHRLAEEIGKRSLVVLISDLFVDNDTLLKALRHFRHRRHEVVVFHVMHEDELTFPFQENTLFRGLESTNQLLTEPRTLRKSYLEALERFTGSVRKCCSNCGIDYVPISTKDPMDAALSGYLAFRQRTMRMAGKR